MYILIIFVQKYLNIYLLNFKEFAYLNESNKIKVNKDNKITLWILEKFEKKLSILKEIGKNLTFGTNEYQDSIFDSGDEWHINLHI